MGVASVVKIKLMICLILKALTVVGALMKTNRSTMTNFALVLDVTGTEELRQKQGEVKLVKHGTFKHHNLIQEHPLTIQMQDSWMEDYVTTVETLMEC